MAYNDPQSVTLSGTTSSLPRVLTGTTVGKFISADAKLELTVDPRGTAKRRRNVARFFNKKDVTVGSITITDQVMVSTTIDRPLTGFTDAEVEAAAAAHLAWLTANTNANLKKLIVGEN